MWLKLIANKYVLGAAGLLLVLAAIWAYGHYQYRQGISDTETAAKLAAAEQYRADVVRINNSVAMLQTRIEELQNAKPAVITQYRDRVVKAPLDATCRIDAERLQHIRDGFSKARATSKSNSPLP